MNFSKTIKSRLTKLNEAKTVSSEAKRIGDKIDQLWTKLNDSFREAIDFIIGNDIRIDRLYLPNKPVVRGLDVTKFDGNHIEFNGGEHSTYIDDISYIGFTEEDKTFVAYIRVIED